MSMIKRVIKHLKSGDLILKIKVGIFIKKYAKSNKISDKEYLERKGIYHLGYRMNLDNPQTFNEKVNWLKLNNHKAIHTTLVDKYLVKDYMSNLIGKQYIVPTYGVYDNFDDINFNSLPEKFIIKCNHDSGGLVICHSKSTFNVKKARKIINNALSKEIYSFTKEWAYKDIKKKIIIEELLEEEGKLVPEDYKVYCFNGKPKYIVVFHNRFNKKEKLSETVYDTNWICQNVSFDNHFLPNSDDVKKPDCLEELLTVSEIIAKDFPQVRVDFYIINNKIYFGEVTLYTASGFQPMIPESLDEELGKLIDLNYKLK